MKKITAFLFLSVNLCLLLPAQKNFTIEEAIIQGKTTLAPGKLKSLVFTTGNGMV